jgi:hypothetical protein
MFNRYGRGRGYRQGRSWGFGFRGTSPPWPYIGIGRGGLPRCGYFLGGAGHITPWRQPYFDNSSGVPAYMPPSSQMTREDELDYLRDQAEAVKEQLNQIDTRMRDLEAEK